jgi:ribosomal protein S27E
VLRDREAGTAGWVIGLLGMLVAMLLALSMISGAGTAEAQGEVALVLTLLSVAGAIAVGLLVAQTYGGEPIGVEVTCPECGSRFVWAAAQSSAACPECRKRVTMTQGQFAELQ